MRLAKQNFAVTTQKIENGINDMTKQYLAQGMPPGRAAFLEGYQRASFALLRDMENSREGCKFGNQMSDAELAFLDGYLKSVHSFVSQIKARQESQK